MKSTNDSLNVLPIILCGGAGSRLWPLSRTNKPKQFHNIVGEETMFVSTLTRVKQGIGFNYLPARIIGGANLESVLVEQVKQSDVAVEQIILEPLMRDTCAAIAAAISDLADEAPDRIVLVLPSDHHISDVKGFNRTIKIGTDAVNAHGGIMTIGIQPTRPETQYGYIEHSTDKGPVYKVERFREKPNLKSAEAYLALGNYFWNSGIFMFRAGDMINELKKQQRQIWDCACAAAQQGDKNDICLLLDKSHFERADKISIDYGVMEHADNIQVVQAGFDWSDLGSWTQLHEIAPQNQFGNVEIGNVETVGVNNSYLRSEDRLLSVCGIDDIVVVSQPDALLITHRDRSYLVKDICNKLAQTNWPQILLPTSGKQIPDSSVIKSWVFDVAMPYWAKNGIDYQQGGVFEALNYHGEPAELDSKRLRVLARQIYSFAQAKHYGWTGDADKILKHCFDTLIKTGWQDEGGWIHRFNNDGSVQDDQRDTYDQAFVLLACASLYRTMGWEDAKHWADKTQTYMDTHLADTKNGGYFEGSKPVEYRRANPHMHYMEAMLEWFEVTQDQSYLDRAAEIIDLFKTKFFDHENWRLHEFFTLDWTPLPNDQNRVEPGHHYEWAWLLLKYCKLSGDTSVKDYARKLYATALSFGHIKHTDAAADSMDFDGSNLSDSARLWPQTEALKAAIALREHGMPGDENLINRMLDQIYNRYLSTPQAGAWFDKTNSIGAVTSQDVQASILYHILVAFIEYLNAESELDQKRI